MHKDTPDHAQWANVDETENPRAFVKFLDDSRSALLPFVESQPEVYYAWMRPEPGMQILDVGSGTGALVHPLAKLIGPSGNVVGIDYSQTMVAEATSRTQGKGLPLEFIQMDAAAMTFADDTFDRAMSSIVFQHLPDPTKSLNEMVRVCKSGALISLNEQDWETFIVDATSYALTRKLLNYFSDFVRNGWIGRQLYGMFVRAGLKDIVVNPQTVRFDQLPFAVFRDCWAAPMEAALSDGSFSKLELDAWMAEQRQRYDEGTFFATFTTFQVVGTKP